MPVATTVRSRLLTSAEMQNGRPSHSTDSEDDSSGPGQQELALFPSQVLYTELQRRRDVFRLQQPYVLKPSESCLAGVVAGIVARTATAPLELIKTLFQLQLTPISKSTPSGYRSMWHALSEIYREEGVKGLWKGNNVGCLRLGPYSGVKFMVYDGLKEWWARDIGPWERLGFGSIAGIAATITTYPLDVVKARMSVQRRGAVYRDTRHALTKILREEGLRGWFKGCFVTLLGVIPFEGVQFAVYETLREYVIAHRWPPWRWDDAKQTTDSVDILIVGSVAGAAGQTVSYPFDLVRKRMQVQSQTHGMINYQYKNAWDCAAQIYRHEGGIRGLFKGTVPNLVRVVPYGAFLFLTYEMMHDFYAEYNVRAMDSKWEHHLNLEACAEDSCDPSQP